MKYLVSITTIIFLITLPILILWQPLAVKLIYSVVHLSANYLSQAQSGLYHSNLPGFTLLETQHLNDVYRLIHTVRLIFGLSLFTLILFWLRLPKRSLLLAGLKIGVLILAGGIFLMGLITWVFWPNSFIWFHLAFFPQGNWSFPANSLLITLYPDIFWQAIFYLYFAIILFMSFLSLIFIRLLKSKHE